MRSLPQDSCDVRRLDGAACGPQAEPSPAPTATPAPSATPEATATPDDHSSEPAPTATPAPTAAATPQPVRFGGLEVPTAVRLSTLRSTGLEFKVTVPTGTKTLRVRLVPRRGARASTKAAAWALVKVEGSGPVTIRWRPRPSAVNKLRAGSYALEVHVGKDADEVGLRRPITLRGRSR